MPILAALQLTERNGSGAPLHLIFVVLALVLFAIAGFGWPAPIDPYRAKLGWCGMFFLVLASFF
jgi:hypothetical protein